MESNNVVDIKDYEDKRITKTDEEVEVIKEENKTKNNVVDIKNYNRKQRRQMARQAVRAEQIKNRKAEQQLNTYATRRELVGLFQSAQKLRDRLFYIDLQTAAIEKLLIEKGVVTEEEIDMHIKYENEKAQQFQEIQNGQKDYENRLKKCIELKVDPNITIIGQQIYEDSEINLDEKIKIAKEYDLKMLLQVLEQLKSE